ncbi:60s acidic ribosomal protein-domain-containing protein [Melampsora americana]|nr:60s acidic ribosomal protein-domain-containing protein [Melampsora americana]
MKYLAAYLLLTQGGNASPSAGDVKALLGTVGIDAEEERLSKLISELNGKSLADLIAEGSAKLASVPSGGGGGAAAAPAAGGAAAADAPKEEAKKAEEKEESDDDMGFGLFDSCAKIASLSLSRIARVFKLTHIISTMSIWLCFVTNICALDLRRTHDARSIPLFGAGRGRARSSIMGYKVYSYGGRT